MEISYAKRTAFTLLMILSFASGITFFCINHIDLISAAIRFHRLNIPNIAYIFMQLIMYLFIPIIFLVPSIFPFARIKLTKIGFIAYGVCHLLTLTWIFYFWASPDSTNIIKNQAVIDFLATGKFVYFPTYWDTYGWLGSVFALVSGILCIKIGLAFDDVKERVKTLLISLMCIYIFLPLISNLFTNGRIFSLYWLTNNFLTLPSLVLFVSAIIVASTHDYAWVEFIWDQSVVSEEGSLEFDDTVEEHYDDEEE